MSNETEQPKIQADESQEKKMEQVETLPKSEDDQLSQEGKLPGEQAQFGMQIGSFVC